MLQHTFIHIPGIGRQTELELWKGGIHNWDDADRFEKRFGVVGARIQKRLDEYIPASRKAILQRNAAFFERLSTLGEAWRVFPEFADQCVYLDIETTGLSTVFDRITVVGLYDGRKYKVFVDGENLDELPGHVKQYSVVVTFNGATFDLRFLRLRFPELVLPPIHIDLRWITRKLGFKGGLKAVEEKFGLKRANEVEDISGYDATVLWAKHLRGEKGALEQLIQYNTEDVVHLKAIMEIAYDKLCEKTTAYLESAIAPMFAGLEAAPKSKSWVVRRHVDACPTESPVLRLLNRCAYLGPSPRIVGIDLTGSTKRATGWALMEGASAKTQSLRTDDELVAATIAAEPALVSIDSPLSLPENHPNPGTPIYRKCELALKRMGISVFWCLLPTMEALTRRGMTLAEELRKRGLRVIESYPGAAQDILGIPRKGTSLDELKWGLVRSGVAGDFAVKRVTHDEIDAITSALVGLFYLADDYIALGTPAEDYLIVPRSPKFNYQRLAEIASLTGLDAIPESSSSTPAYPVSH
ncbi:MAG TPA: ribonuclease H-like domain-containing protein [Candidatus Acidoferrum sp.]|nr:ribonuclease H-like domain-containing protein [Candidatus Acidoferrum sp.]